MAGKDEDQPAGDDVVNSGSTGGGADGGEAKAKKSLAKSLSCTNCGAPITLRFPGASISIVCPNCHSVLDAQDENYRVLVAYHQRTRSHTVHLPLGSRGKLKGKQWEVIGFMVRADVSSGYSWQEYLLFNPYYGFRWLTEDQGNWNFVTTTKTKPDDLRTSNRATLDGVEYQIYNQGQARVDYVVGEFYWQVSVGSQVYTADFISPPYMLSMERDGTEKIWSVGEYVDPMEVLEAFKPEKGIPKPYGIPATYPPTEKRMWQRLVLMYLVFWGVITCAQVYFLRTAENINVLDYQAMFEPNTKKSDVTTPVFTVTGKKGNIQINSQADVSNSWFWYSGEIVNNDTGESYPFEQSIEYYTGYDSDGYWSEGGNTSSRYISSVPGGKYYMNIDYESGDFKDNVPRNFQIRVFRNVWNFENYLWITFFLSFVPIMQWCKMRQIEVKRWSNSDFNPYTASVSYSSD